MSFQYTYDTDGKPLGVFVPLNEWEKIASVLKNKKRKSTRSKEKKTHVIAGIVKGLRQVKSIESGRMKSISLQQLLDEL